MIDEKHIHESDINDINQDVDSTDDEQLNQWLTDEIPAPVTHRTSESYWDEEDNEPEEEGVESTDDEDEGSGDAEIEFDDAEVGSAVAVIPEDVGEISEEKREKTVKELFNELKVEDDFYEILTEYVARGKTEIQQNRIVETLELDDTWINTIENCLVSLEKIVKDPKKSIIDYYELVNVEKARRTDSNTVRHLSQHTSYIRKIEDDGRINPSKVLTRAMDEDMLIYENRFVVALINNLLYFVTGRYNAIKKNIDTYDTTNLKMNSKFKLRRGDVEFDLNLRIRNETRNRVVLQKNHMLLGKLDNIRKRINIITGTYFYRLVSKAKPVVPPIMKTNIINMQKDYNACYKLWLFISSYNTVGYSVDVTTKNLKIDTDYYDDLTMLIALTMKTLFNNHAVRRLSYKKTPFKRHAKRRYKEIRKIDYDQYARNVANFDDRDGINQFYYDKIKDMIMKKEELKPNELKNVVTVKASFNTFYKSITDMTNEIFNDVMGLSKIDVPLKKIDSLQKKYYAYAKQDEYFKKYQLLSRLKLKDLQKTLLKENTQKIKLEKLRFDYEFALEKANAGKKRKRKIRKPKTAAFYTAVDEKKIAALYEAARIDEAKRMEKELERQRIIREKEEERLARLAKAREDQKKIREIAKKILIEQQKEEERLYGEKKEEKKPAEAVVDTTAADENAEVNIADIDVYSFKIDENNNEIAPAPVAAAAADEVYDFSEFFTEEDEAKPAEEAPPAATETYDFSEFFKDEN